MNIYVLCIEETVPSAILESLLEILAMSCEHYLNTAVSIVTTKSTTFGVKLPYNITPTLTAKCNCSNQLQTFANLTCYIALQTAY